MRAVSFVERLEFECPGSVFKNAIALGDVDNDSAMELVVGSDCGEVLIFKGSSGVKCWRKACDLGMVTAVGIGDIFNKGRNSLVVVNGEGWLYIFDFPVGAESDDILLKPVHVQRIVANTKVLLLHDVNSDGLVELVIGLTDRVVRTYQWTNTKFVGLNKWEFANQIGTVAINDMANRSPSLLVAHPGGTFIRLKCKPLEDQGKEEQRELLSKMSIDYHPLAYSHMRNTRVSTEILGNISQGKFQQEGKGGLYAVATLDGTLMLVVDEQILWSIQVDHQLFALSKLDITGDDREEVIACSWDGQTYIINQEKQTVRFQFDHSVSAFVAGYFSLLRPDQPEEPPRPSLVYATFHNKIYLYYNVTLPRITLNTLADVLVTTPVFQQEENKKYFAQSAQFSELVAKTLYNEDFS